MAAQAAAGPDPERHADHLPQRLRGLQRRHGRRADRRQPLPVQVGAAPVEQQVKLLGGRVSIDKPKGGNTRTVPLPDTVAVEVAEHLRRYPAAGDDLVFTSREHKPVNRNHFNRYTWRPRSTRVYAHLFPS